MTLRDWMISACRHPCLPPGTYHSCLCQAWAVSAGQKTVRMRAFALYVSGFRTHSVLTSSVRTRAFALCVSSYRTHSVSASPIRTRAALCALSSGLDNTSPRSQCVVECPLKNKKTYSSTNKFVSEHAFCFLCVRSTQSFRDHFLLVRKSGILISLFSGVL